MTSQTPPADRAADPACDATVYYDGACPLCTVEIGHYAGCEGGDRINFVDVSQAGAEPGPDLAREDALRRFHVRSATGELVSGARAFILVWESLPGWRWAARIARLPGVTPLMELGYRAFLPIRPALSWIAARLGAKPAMQRRTKPSGGDPI